MYDDPSNTIEQPTDWWARLTSLATTGAQVYTAATAKPQTAGGPPPVNSPKAMTMGGLNPWAIGAAALALIVGLVLLLRR